MPFQISLHSNVKQRGVINSFSAGEDQIAICAPEVTLVATIDGVLAGHTVFWEQLSGDQVLWLTPQNQIVVTFATVSAGSTDRVFRFYVDKGTPLEQHDDIVVWGTPTEQETTLVSICSIPPSTDIACRNIPCDSVHIEYDLGAPTIMGTATVNPLTGYSIAWNSPTCDTNWFVSTTVIHNDTGNLTKLGDFPLGVNTTPITAPYDAYYLYVNYEQQHVKTTQYSCRYVAIPRDDQFIYATDTGSVTSVVNSITPVYYSLTPFVSPTDTLDNIHSTLNTYSATYYTLEQAPHSTSIQDTITSVINTTSATYYSNNGIGG